MNTPWLDSCRVPRSAVGLALVVGIVSGYYATLPLHHTDLWGHLAYGRLIAATRQLPATEPFIRLSRDKPLVDTAWLSQIVGFEIQAMGGLPGLQALHGLSIGVCFLLLAWRGYSQTRSAAATLMGLAVFELLNWYQFQIIRPQLGGLVCFVFILFVLTSDRWRTAQVVMTPATITLWANLHGSFIIGWVLLLSTAIGAGLDQFRRPSERSAMPDQAAFFRLLLTTVLAGLAPLINPYGFRLYAEVLAISRHPNLRDLIEWQQLNLQTNQGRFFVAAALTLCATTILAQRPLRAREITPLAVFGLLSLWSARLLIWWTPLAALALMGNIQAIVLRFFPAASVSSPGPRRLRWTMCAALVLVLGTGGANTLFRSRGIVQDENATALGAETPRGAAAWLVEHPPHGPIFNTYEWGDYLVWAGPPDLQVFVTSHAHLVPASVWRDYLTAAYARTGWNQVFDRYGITTIVVDRAERGRLIRELERSPVWETRYEDAQSVIFSRHESPSP
ncbi:MAG: hypothetical protein JSS02_34425 [Planctomycetes bacterium]|nr:hypothetical protein [Planctomycetota bacterium]